MPLTPNKLMAAEGLLKDEALTCGITQTHISDYANLTNTYYTDFTNTSNLLQSQVGLYSTNPLDMNYDIYALQRNLAQSTVDSFNNTFIQSFSDVIGNIPAPYIQLGSKYTIVTTGTTDFTLIGSANNTPGTVFIATGAGAGTGTVLSTISVSLLSDLINKQITNFGFIGPNESDGRFIAQMQVANGYIQLVNPYINAAGSDLAINTFTTMDDLTTGNITGINSNTAAWGQELINTGYLFDFSRLHVLGTPQALAETLIRTGLIGFVSDALTAQNIDIDDMQSAIQKHPNEIMKPSVQKRCYTAFATITGQELDDILYTLQVVTPGITVLTDLLDLRKIFPTTYNTLRSLNNGDFENIFVSATQLSTYVSAIDTELVFSMPTIVAKSNEKFRCALQTLKGIYDAEPKLVGQAAIDVEKDTGLTIINALPKAVPDGIENIFYELYPGGTGPNGTFYITDIVGTAAGIPHNDNLTNIMASINSVSLTFFTDVYTVMTDVIGGVYCSPPGNYSNIVIPPLTPGEGTYTSVDDAIIALVNYIVTGLAGFTAEIIAADDAFYSSMNAILRELFLFSQSNIFFSDSGTSQFNNTSGGDGAYYDRQVILGFADTLDTYGQGDDNYDVRYVLEHIADTSTRSGQAILAAMIEGRNKIAIGSANITADNEF